MQPRGIGHSRAALAGEARGGCWRPGNAAPAKERSGLGGSGACPEPLHPSFNSVGGIHCITVYPPGRRRQPSCGLRKPADPTRWYV